MADPFYAHERLGIDSHSNYPVPSLSDLNYERSQKLASPYNHYREPCKEESLNHYSPFDTKMEPQPPPRQQPTSRPAKHLGGQKPRTQITRQSAGHTCDRCREKRVRCGREKPSCQRCVSKGAICHYSERMRMYDRDKAEARITKLHREIAQVKYWLDAMEPHLHKPAENKTVDNNHSVSSNMLSMQELVGLAGWTLIEREDGVMTLNTNIRLLDDLRATLLKLLGAMYGRAGLPLRPGPGKSESSQFQTPFTYAASTNRQGAYQNMIVFEKLNRYKDDSHSYQTMQDETPIIIDASALEESIIKYADCGFPVLVTPKRWPDRYPFCTSEFSQNTQATIYCTANIHGARFHQHRDEEVEQLVDLAFPIVHDTDLGNLSVELIWKLFYQVTYDLDYGSIEKAYLNIGIMVRACFALDLHVPAGYSECKDIYALEQAKRLFWCTWLFDSLVPQFFGRSTLMNPEDIKVDLPCIIEGMTHYEIERTEYVRYMIKARMISRQIYQAKATLSNQEEAHVMPKVTSLEQVLRTFHDGLPDWIKQEGSPIAETTWRRRIRYCTLIENCTNWISLYRQFLPPLGELRNLTHLEKLALSRCTESATTLQTLFIAWLAPTYQETDCMFRPYLYHYMATIDTYKVR
ncbi:hypothetical protein INT44_000079 [Umbelopsis vinacea]|uniref:Zn(2)-C6 fungal-type domain-containing protein n=1 Tax=Umbelopsis vinacea TaxID=44442 RepID=A0A8H7PHA3_9FUNG|nr:hypothetical protein INT44_000079 [Umbelopsis vinacea]